MERPMKPTRACARLLHAVCLVAAGAPVLLAQLDGSYVLPMDDPAIAYAQSQVTDPVSRLNDDLQKGKRKLAFDETHGYLRSLLEALEVPVHSQVLVFSKTSFQATRISPRLPRALYFNDRISVGFVRSGDVLEVMAADPKQGMIFYTLDQDSGAKPQLIRRDECLQCHLSPRTTGVPGWIVRSVYPDSSGMPLFQAGSFVTDHRSPFKERWGGWYVTGKHGAQLHMGNVYSQSKSEPDMDFSKGANVTDLKWHFDTGAYLTRHSDIVALMVLEHQGRMQNLITRVGFDARMALRDQAALAPLLNKPGEELTDSTRRRINLVADALVQYMLFAEEAPLAEPIEGTSGFTQEFQKLGPADKKGRSLRDLDLRKRLFRYPCSYLIYSEPFDGLPAPAKQRVYERLWEVLSGKDKSAAFARLSTEDRQAVREILLETKGELPEYWRP